MSHRTLLLLAFGIAQAILYSSLMPLWEGFDEPWHYGYVQYLSTSHRFPVLGETHLSHEVWDSMLASPVSHVVHDPFPELQTFDQYFRLTPEARALQRSTLEHIPANRSETARANYEIQHPPLAYAILAIPDYLLRNASVPLRILWLRIFNSVLCAILVFIAAQYLFGTLGLPAAYSDLGIFCIFACQMYWATTAHIACDGIALVLSLWYFGAIAAFAQKPQRATALRLSLAAALGLLAKAYFLPLAAFALCLIAIRRIRLATLFVAIVALLAGPWYARNLALYHNLTGLQMNSAGIPVRQSIEGLLQVNWLRAIPYMLRGTLWTGNNSFTTFSSITLNCLLALLAAGLVLYAWRNRKPEPGAAAVLGASAILIAAVVWVTGNDVFFVHGRSAGAEPWYTEPLLPPLLAIALLSMNRVIAAAVCALWTYICIATYVVKLIPLYGGYPEGRSTLSGILHWYAAAGPELQSITLAPPLMIYLETALVSGLAIVLATLLTTRVLRQTVALCSTRFHLR